MGRVTIGSHVFDLPDEEASSLGEAAMVLQRRGGWISPSDDLLISVTSATEVSIEISGEFAGLQAAKPAAILEKQTSPRRAVSLSSSGQISTW